MEFDEPYVLVTPGGGGDGYNMVDWVLSAYEANGDLPFAPLFVLGPFMNRRPAGGAGAAHRTPPAGAGVMTFDSHVEILMAEAAGVISMCGYNTFCEILSFDKPAVIVPRSRPRQEQLVRARQAERLGLVRMLDPDGPRDPEIMAEAIRNLPSQPRPSSALLPDMLKGLERVVELARPHLRGETEAPASEGGTHGADAGRLSGSAPWQRPSPSF